MNKALILLLLATTLGGLSILAASDKPRVIVTSDDEIADECFMVLLQSSSQYHWQGHKWAGDDWVQPYLKACRDLSQPGEPFYWKPGR